MHETPFPAPVGAKMVVCTAPVSLMRHFGFYVVEPIM